MCEIKNQYSKKIWQKDLFNLNYSSSKINNIIVSETRCPDCSQINCDPNTCPGWN